MSQLFFKILSWVWFIPFGFYKEPLKKSRVIPHPLAPRNLRDLILNKMMFPDNILRAVVADKIATRGWVEEKLGIKYLVPLYDICETAQDLQIHKYPLPCVIKSNHASTQVRLVKQKSDFNNLVTEATDWLSKEYEPKKEWVYRDIKPRLLVEKMLLDDAGNLAADIKIHCFFGEPVLIIRHATLETSDGSREIVRHFMSPQWEKLDIVKEYQSKTPAPPVPDCLEEMLAITRKLSADFDYIRVDLYLCKGSIYVGELTNFYLAGSLLFTPLEYDTYLLSEYHRMRDAKISTLRAKYADTGAALIVNADSPPAKVSNYPYVSSCSELSDV
ncbi:MAG: ATP-grasp fold amidoligase family protein [Paracoccaceae bacterium]